MQAWYFDFQNLHANRHRAVFGPRSYCPQLAPQPVLLDLPALARSLEKLFGPARQKRAYADWGPFGAYAPDLNRCLFEAVQVPSTRGGKNAADIALAVDAVLEAGADPGVDVVVIGSNDSDFSQLALKLRRMGKRVVGLGVADCGVSALFRAACDQYLFYPGAPKPAPPTPTAAVAAVGNRGGEGREPAAQNAPPVQNPPNTPEPKRGGRWRKSRRKANAVASPVLGVSPSPNGTPGSVKK